MNFFLPLQKKKKPLSISTEGDCIVSFLQLQILKFIIMVPNLLFLQFVFD